MAGPSQACQIMAFAERFKIIITMEEKNCDHEEVYG